MRRAIRHGCAEISLSAALLIALAYATQKTLRVQRLVGAVARGRSEVFPVKQDLPLDRSELPKRILGGTPATIGIGCGCSGKRSTVAFSASNSTMVEAEYPSFQAVMDWTSSPSGREKRTCPTQLVTPWSVSPDSSSATTNASSTPVSSQISLTVTFNTS